MPYAKVGDFNIHYKVEGNGPPLIMLHGFAGSTETWRIGGYVDELKGNNQLILIDSLGHGKSDKPHEVRAYEQKTKPAVISIMDELGIDTSNFFGYSAGGLAGFNLAYNFSTRFKSMILGGASPISDAHPIQNEWIRALESSMDDFITLIGLSDEEPEVRAMFLANDNLALAAMVKVRLTADPIRDYREHLPTMNMPFLLYAGDKDNIFSYVEMASKILQDATFVPVPGANHNQTFGNHYIFPHIKEFLARVNK